MKLQITVAILSTMLTIWTFLTIIGILIIRKAFKKRWLVFGNPREADKMIDELSKIYEEDK